MKQIPLKTTVAKLFCACALLLGTTNISAQKLAFPGAEGAGKFVTGGRGTAANPTTVFEVTSLADNDVAGTLRHAINANATYRTIVFRVSGTIHLLSPLKVPGNTTIAGQTAPGDGITLADYWTTLNGENIIVRYMRFRMGDKNQLIVNDGAPAGCDPRFKENFTATCIPKPNVAGSYDAFGGSYKKNIMIDHCSVSWSDDEALSLKESDSTTIQWTIVSEPLNYSYHFETLDGTAKTAPEDDFQEHGYGGIFGGFHATFHHNIYAHCKSRTPRFGASGADKTRVDFRNNVIYNWGINNVYGGEGGEFNVVNNYYKSGSNTTKHCRFVDMDSTASYFVSGNKMDDPTCGAIVQKNRILTTPVLPNLIPATETAEQAYTSVLANAGASLKRDSVDLRVINDIKNRTGHYIDVQGGFAHGTLYATSRSAWPVLSSLAAPIDSDHDGMPDAWETSKGLNPNSATDRSGIGANAYTNLEVYLNDMINAIEPPTILLSPGTLASQPAVSRTAQQYQVFDLQGRLRQSSSTAPHLQAGHWVIVTRDECGHRISSWTEVH